MNLPNKLTIFRIFCVPFEVFLLLSGSSKQNFIFAFLLFLVLAISDFFDGKIARKENKVTVLGKFLDPLADKILILSIFLCFLHLNLISVVAVIILVNREFIVTAVRLLAANNNLVISANFWGKLKTFLQIFVIILIFLAKISSLQLSILEIIISLSVDIMVIFSVISGIIYVYDNRNLFMAN